MAWTTLGTVAPGDVLRANSGTAAYNNVIGNLGELRSYANKYAEFRRSTGDVTLTGTSTWSTLTTIGTGGDLTLAAAAGDQIQAGIFFAVLPVGAASLAFDWVTVVSGTVTNSFSLAAAAPATWSNLNATGWHVAGAIAMPFSGSQHYTLGAGDVSGGNVVLRLRYAMSSAVNKEIYAAADRPLVLWARNHGPIT
jgi:hypothetical protein